MTSCHTVTVSRLSSGYYRLQGLGPCNWAQVPHWPCDEQTLRANAFPEACEEFLRETIALSNRTDEERHDGT